LLHIAVTFHHFFTVLLSAQSLPFQKILYSPPLHKYTTLLILSVG